MSRSLIPMLRSVGVLSLAAACHRSPAPASTPGVTPAPAPARPTARAGLLAVRVNGTPLSYRLFGDPSATTVVFVHGSLGDLEDWDAQVDTFARTHQVLVYSRRYHPPNPPQNDGQVYSPTLHAEDLAALLSTLGVAPAHVVGSSYGAYTALELALERPELVRTLVLGEPPVIPLLLRTPEGDSIRRAFSAATLEPARAAFARRDSVLALRLFVDGMNGTPGRFANLPAPARAKTLAHSFEMRKELLADPQRYLPTLRCADLGRLAMPILLVEGERSPRMFHVITEELARCLRSDTTIVVPGAGHSMHTGNPGYYNQMVLWYLATH